MTKFLFFLIYWIVVSLFINWNALDVSKTLAVVISRSATRYLRSESPPWKILTILSLPNILEIPFYLSSLPHPPFHPPLHRSDWKKIVAESFSKCDIILLLCWYLLKVLFFETLLSLCTWESIFIEYKCNASQNLIELIIKTSNRYLLYLCYVWCYCYKIYYKWLKQC